MSFAINDNRKFEKRFFAGLDNTMEGFGCCNWSRCVFGEDDNDSESIPRPSRQDVKHSLNLLQVRIERNDEEKNSMLRRVEQLEKARSNTLSSRIGIDDIITKEDQLRSLRSPIPRSNLPISHSHSIRTQSTHSGILRVGIRRTVVQDDRTPSAVNPQLVQWFWTIGPTSTSATRTCCFVSSTAGSGMGRGIVRAGVVRRFEFEGSVQEFRGELEHFLYDGDTFFVVGA